VTAVGDNDATEVRGRHRRRQRLRPDRLRLPVVAAVAGALCVPAAVVVALLARHVDSSATKDDARAAAVVAAQRDAHDLLSYDYRSLDRDVARAQAETTGTFARQYRATASQLLAEARQVRAIVQATVSTPGVVRASADTVVVLVFVDQASVKQLPGQKSPTTRIDQSRVRMTMQNAHGRWLVAQLDAL
jgi:Mce-associated membrane protein